MLLPPPHLLRLMAHEVVDDAVFDAIHPCNADEVDFYEQNLYSPSEAERLPCSARFIVYSPTIVAGFIALLVKQHGTGKSLPREVLLDLRSLLLSH